MVTRPRLLVSLFRECGEAAILCGGQSVFVAIEAVPPVFSEGSSAGGWCQKATSRRRVIGLNGRAYIEYPGK